MLVPFIAVADDPEMNDSSIAHLVCDALIAQNPQLDRMQAVALTMEGLVHVNGCPARHPSQRVRRTDQVTIDGSPSPGNRPRRPPWPLEATAPPM